MKLYASWLSAEQAAHDVLALRKTSEHTLTYEASNKQAAKDVAASVRKGLNHLGLSSHYSVRVTYRTVNVSER